MLSVKQQVVLGHAAEFGVVFARLGVQAAGQGVAVLRLAVMLDGIGGGTGAVGPPVGQVAVVHRAVLQLGRDGRVQLLQADHADPGALRVAAGVLLNDAQDLRLRRGVVAEHARHAGHHKVVAVAVLLAQGQVVLQVLVHGVHRVGGGIGAKVLHHKVGGAVGLQAQHVAQVVVLAVPHQHPLAGSTLPPVGGLVLVQRVHAVVAVDVGVQELDAVVQHGVPLAHRDAVDVGAHGGFGGDAVGVQQGADLVQAALQHVMVGQVAEVQVVGRKADAAFLHAGKERLGLLRRGLLQKLLDTEPGLAVPAEAVVFRVLHQLQRAADVVDLALHHPLLQVGVADVGVGMVHNIKGFDGMAHRGTSQKHSHIFSGGRSRLGIQSSRMAGAPQVTSAPCMARRLVSAVVSSRTPRCRQALCSGSKNSAPLAVTCPPRQQSCGR